MGCASSKPSKDKKNSSNKKLKQKAKSNDVIQENQVKETSPDRAETPIHLDKNLIDQIKKSEVQVVEYISKIVHNELNNELVRHATSKTVDNQSADLASTALAAKNQQENDDLIVDVSSKAINTIVNTPLPNTSLTYKSLNSSLRAWKFLCKNQANKSRIIDLTTETIQQSLAAINEELAQNTEFDLLNFIAQNSTITPPQTPVKEHSQEEIWNSTAILLNRTKANQLARLLFLSNKARPIIHSSNRIKDAYFVNRELKDKSQVTITQAEIDEILNNSTYKNNPHITPVTGRKLDFNSDLLQVNRTDQSASKETTESNENDTKLVTVENTTAAMDNLTEPSDFEKVEVINLTSNTTAESSVTEPEKSTSENQQSTEQSTDTKPVETSETNDQPSNSTNQDTEFLDDIVKEINNLQASTSNETSKDTERVIDETNVDVTVTPPTTPEANDGLVEIVKEIVASSVSAEINAVESATSNSTADDNVNNSEEKKETNENNATSDSTNDENETQKVSNDSQTVSDDGKLDPVLKQELLDDRFYNNDSFKNGPPVNGTDAENEAATKIQASFKGEQTRQEINIESANEEKSLENNLSTDSSNVFEEEMDKAATKIQSTYRGFKARKSLSITLKQKVEQEIEENKVDQVGEVSETNVEENKKNEAELKESESTKPASTEPQSKECEEITVEKILEVLDTKPAVIDEAPKKKNSKKKRNRKKSPKQDVPDNEGPSTPESPSEKNVPLITISDHEQLAATKIQSTFRGFKTRKDLSQQINDTKNKD